jgi:hypothetical protein
MTLDERLVLIDVVCDKLTDSACSADVGQLVDGLRNLAVYLLPFSVRLGHQPPRSGPERSAVRGAAEVAVRNARVPYARVSLANAFVKAGHMSAQRALELLDSRRMMPSGQGDFIEGAID